MVLGIVGPIGVGLGRERIGRARGQDDEVRSEDFTRTEDDLGAVDLGCPIMDDPSVCEEPGVRDEDGREKARVHQTAQCRDVVEERVLGLHQGHVGHLVEGLGHIDAAIAAPDHDDRWPASLFSHSVPLHLVSSLL